ncbi:MAG: S-layer y domain protein [Caproiciproducens sp.]|nr:S-layer y domain protein [Caproiciproducens sp.]
MINNEDKANAKQKALIDKLAAEFALEINKIDTRVTKIEKNQSVLKIDGFFRSQYEYTKNQRSLYEDLGNKPFYEGRADGKANLRQDLWLNITNQFDGKTYFHGVLLGESISGKTTDVDVQVKEAFVGTKISDQTEIAYGGFSLLLAKGCGVRLI